MTPALRNYETIAAVKPGPDDALIAAMPPMTDRPLILPGWAVHAVLREIEAPGSGKSQHRVVLRDQPGELDRPFKMDDGTWHVTDSRGGHMSQLSVEYRDGGRLWVRETWAPVPVSAARSWGDVPWRWNPDDDYEAAIFRASFDRSGPGTSWRSSATMPRWASRLTLRVTDVRVQRVQDITEEDALAEGCPAQSDEDLAGMEARGWFRDEWSTRYGADAWRQDWVAALTFRPIPRNIDMEA